MVRILHCPQPVERQQKNGDMKRNAIIDITKAIGILFVIIGHNSTGLLCRYIYSFHMPLFFIVSGFLYRQKDVIISLRHDFTKILVPYFFYFLITKCLIPFTIEGVHADSLLQELLRIVYGSNQNIEIKGHHIQGVGYLWFLPALFDAKTVST